LSVAQRRPHQQSAIVSMLTMMRAILPHSSAPSSRLASPFCRLPFAIFACGCAALSSPLSPVQPRRYGLAHVSHHTPESCLNIFQTRIEVDF